MKLTNKSGLKKARQPSRFTLSASAAMVAMAVSSMSAMAGPGRVCLDGVTPLTNASPSCAAGTVGTYYANSPRLRKFVDTLAGLSSAGANTFASGAPGEYISIAEPDSASYPGSEYFTIGVIEHDQRMHSDLQKATTQRSYVQLYPPKSERPAVFGTGDVPIPQPSAYAGFGAPNPGAPVALKYPDGKPIYWPGTTEQVYGYDKAHYLGPVVITFKGAPVRIKFVNFLPTGRADIRHKTVIARNGDMFLPTDESLAGAGLTPAGDKYPQNRVAFHLHGGDSPWISDGTPHQWVAAAGDSTPYKHGDRFVNTPDMPYPGDGAQTTFWPNDQSARLMWYHDHTFGLTRQNAYSGAAAGYVIIDPAELALLTGGTLPDGQTVAKAIPGGLLDQIVLVIQDKTFVPNDIAVQDSKWDKKAWGKPGDLWYPHVYEPIQVWDKGGNLGATAPGQVLPAATAPAFINPAGRWDYGIDDATGGYRVPNAPLRNDPDYGKVAFPDGTYFGGPSATPESYMDTPVVNGIAYPVLNVEPKSYRVRFLNGANDRYWNLSLWVADKTRAVVEAAGRPGTEVKMVPADGNAIYKLADGTTYAPADGRPGGVPDPHTAGPNIIRFGNEGGLLAAPVVHTPSPMNGFNDPLAGFTLARDAGANFYLGGAERADTVIDFSKYAGKTLILYNDSSAPVPGGDSRYDYYTGDPDQSTAGGASTTLPGYGPNTRTVMQIKVAAKQANGAAPAPAFDPDGNGGPLFTELPKAYAASADAHVVESAALKPGALPSLDPAAATITFPDSATPIPLKVKTIRGITDPNFGRLIAQIGYEIPNLPDPLGTPLAYIDTPNDVISDGETQYWWIKNNDVDNHPMHFHLFNVQVVARVDHATGALLPPQPDETGWKETIKNWPLEDVIVAIRPKTPALPFGLPKSVRNLDPTLPAGASNSAFNRPGADLVSAFFQYDVNTGLPLATPLVNSSADFDWEYVWHCHILGHEENDLMRPLVFHPVPPTVPQTPPGNVSVDANGQITWTDPTPALDGNGDANAATKGNTDNEIGFRVERAVISTSGTSGNPTMGAFFALAPTSPVIDARVNTLANATSFQDTPAKFTDYAYRVVSVNEGGVAVSSGVSFGQAPAAPTGLQVTAGVGLPNNTLPVTLTWTDVATNETGYTVSGAVAASLGANATSFSGTIPMAVAGNVYQFQVAATKTGFGSSPFAQASLTPVAALKAPTALTAVTNAQNKTAALSWVDQSFAESGYKVTRAPVTISSSTGRPSIGPASARPTATSTLPTNATTVTDTALAANTLYQYQVAALSGSTTGTPASLYVTTASSLGAAPGQVQADGGPARTSLGIQWQNTQSPLATGYEVEHCVGTAANCSRSGAQWVPIPGTLTVGASSTKFVAAGLTSRTTYSFRVRAVNSLVRKAANGEPGLVSAWSAIFAAKTL